MDEKFPEPWIAWKTEDELTFLRHLGKSRWSQSASCQEAGREKLLRRYKAAILNRVDWGIMDMATIQQVVDQSLIEFQ